MTSGKISPTTSNILALAEKTPFILLKKDPGSKRADKVFKELLATTQEDLLVCRHENGVVLIRKSSARQFIV